MKDLPPHSLCVNIYTLNIQKVNSVIESLFFCLFVSGIHSESLVISEITNNLQIYSSKKIVLDNIKK